LIAAVKHHIKFFHFHFTKAYLRSFQTLNPCVENSDIKTYLQIHSTHWFDTKESVGCKNFVRNFLALIAYADAAIDIDPRDAAESDSESDMESSEDSEGEEDLMDMEE
jgi:hypothetical protein